VLMAPKLEIAVAILAQVGVIPAPTVHGLPAGAVE